MNLLRAFLIKDSFLKFIFAIINILKSTALLLDFQKHINTNFSFLKNKKILIANSGGIDSIVLTSLLYQLKYNISLAHCNFKLRDNESDLDEEFVKSKANALQIPFFVTHFKTNKYATSKGISIQMAARELRYNWFEEILIKHNFDFLLTAHHADDSLETFLINFSRGTGLDGLTGIPKVNNKTLRPLLAFTRKDIEGYAKANKITWREDQSNLETKYLRNNIRHDLIPIFKELNPNFMESFSKTIEHLQGSQQIINDSINTIKNEVTRKEDGILKFNIQKLKQLTNTKAYLFELFSEYGFTEWDDVASLLHAQSGKQVYSKTHRLLKDRDFLILDKVINDNLSNSYKIEANDTSLEMQKSKLKIEEMNLVNFKDLDGFGKNIICLDKSLLTFPLTVRKWKNGDYFYPIGMRGKKKLSKYFKDEKLSLLEKENIWLLCSENEIVWVINNRLDDRFKITSDTKKLLKIEFVK